MPDGNIPTRNILQPLPVIWEGLAEKRINEQKRGIAFLALQVLTETLNDGVDHVGFIT